MPLRAAHFAAASTFAALARRATHASPAQGTATGGISVFSGDAGTVVTTTIAGFPAFAVRPTGDVRGIVVFLHGVFSDHTSFAPFLRSFADAGYASIAFSRRGRCGIGPVGSAGVTLGQHLGDVRKVLHALPGRAVVVGHDLGGLLAQHVAVEGRCRAVVLLASAPPGAMHFSARALTALASSLPKIAAGLPFRPSDRAIASLALHRLPANEQERVLQTLAPESGRVFRAMMLGTRAPTTTRVECPMLVTGGTDDRFISTSALRKTAAVYGAPLELFAGMGHWVMEEAGHENVAALVQAWMRGALHAR